jgi:hypothetical protein
MKTLQLQFWAPKARTYVPSEMGNVPMDCGTAMVNRSIEALADHARAVGRPWRIASAERPLKPKYSRSGMGASRGRPSRTIEQVQLAYVYWAKAKGLERITYYRSDAGKFACAAWHGEKRFITPEEQFAVVESHETDSRLNTLMAGNRYATANT